MIGFAYLQYLSINGFLSKPDCRILDIGSQNLMNCTLADIQWLVERHGGIRNMEAFRSAAVKIAYFATPRPGETTTYLSELIDLTNIKYTSYDVAPGHKTTIFDLNSDEVPAADRGQFDVVMNLGTTEHVINQLHSFKVMHDALKVGGVAFHQVPAAGWLTHGYFAYRPQLFRDLEQANGYSILDMWYNVAGQDMLDPAVDVRLPESPLVTGSGKDKHPVDCLNYNINVLIKKNHDAPFRWGLELATSHAGVATEMAERYGLNNQNDEPPPPSFMRSLARRLLIKIGLR